MRFRAPLSFALALLFAVGQWLAVAHASTHELQGQIEKTPCEICALAHAHGGTPAPTVAPTVFGPHQEQAAQRTPAQISVSFVALPPSRGPPLLV